jgi:uncharacterized membrane protein YeiH
MPQHPVELTRTLEEVLNLTGIFVFGISGALLAVRKNFDIIGMTVLAEITALGGGVIRDLIIGAHPPAAFTDIGYLLVPLLATAVTFFAHPRIERIRIAVLVFDAAGLGLFCVSGTVVALAHGLGPVQAVVLGVTTGIGGGILRDTLAGEIPFVLRADSELYAVPAILGSAIVVLTAQLHVYGPAAPVLSAVLVFALRVASLRFGWRAPQPRP